MKSGRWRTIYTVLESFSQEMMVRFAAQWLASIQA
jgi:hypothetical protein